MDMYTIRARLIPVFLVISPIIVAIVAWFPETFVGWKVLGGVLATFGASALLSQLGRDAGKKKEPLLFSLWAGNPAVRLLRHEDGGLDHATRSRYHAKLASLLGLPLPTLEKEMANQNNAAALYESCVRYLREKTRDKKRFRLIFQENMNYGFRRNLWAMRSAGILCSTVGLAGTLVPIILRWTDALYPLPIQALGAAINVIFLVWWAIRITPAWVRLPADAYAEQLLAACDSL